MDRTIIINDPTFEPACIANHMGPWMVEPHWFAQAVNSVKAGMFQVQPPDPSGFNLFSLDQSGVATISMVGPMMKGDSKFGGTNTLRTRRAIRSAVADTAVKAVLLHIDSPGGTAAGTEQLANDVRKANTKKPVHAHIEDTGASAAYWVASQARRITATPMSEVGSLGTIAVVEDASEQYGTAGVKVHVISTGPYKGAFTGGVPITEEHLEFLQGLVDGLNKHFLDGVSRGRGMAIGKVRESADGRWFLAAEAQERGLIDAVGTIDDATHSIRMEAGRVKKETRGRALAIARAQV
jgi:signal peptide peptidase SppA